MLPYPVRLKRLSLLPLFCTLLSLAGCGTKSSIPPTPRSRAANLVGNWLAFGTLAGAGSDSFPSEHGLAFSVDAIGDQLIGTASYNVACGPNATSVGTLGAVLTGTVADDGTFTLGTPTNGLPVFENLVIHGSVPNAPGGTWYGTYKFTGVDLNPKDCSFDFSGSFTPTHIASISGTYSGSGSYFGNSNGQAAPIALTLNLQQGALLYAPLNSPVLSSNLALGGTMQIEGISCFNTGMISATRGSIVEGSKFLANFAASDGSNVAVLGSIGDAGSTTLNVQALSVTGGNCAGGYDFFPLPGVLTRKP